MFGSGWFLLASGLMCLFLICACLVLVGFLLDSGLCLIPFFLWFGSGWFGLVLVCLRLVPVGFCLILVSFVWFVLCFGWF